MKNTLAHPTTTIMMPSHITCGCTGHCNACFVFLSFDDFASHAWRTCILSRHVSQHSSSCRLAHHACMQRTVVNDTLLCATKKHINFDCQIGQKVLKYDKMLQGKLKPKTTGPFDLGWHLSFLLTTKMGINYLTKGKPGNYYLPIGKK